MAACLAAIAPGGSDPFQAGLPTTLLRRCVRVQAAQGCPYMAAAAASSCHPDPEVALTACDGGGPVSGPNACAAYSPSAGMQSGWHTAITRPRLWACMNWTPGFSWDNLCWLVEELAVTKDWHHVHGHHHSSVHSSVQRCPIVAERRPTHPVIFTVPCSSHDPHGADPEHCVCRSGHLLSARASTAGSSSAPSTTPSNGKGLGWLAKLCGELPGESGTSSVAGDGLADRSTSASARRLAGLQAAVRDLRDKLRENGGKVRPSTEQATGAGWPVDQCKVYRA